MRFITIILAATALCAVTLPAFSADSGVIIINPDGSVTDTDDANNPLTRHDAARAAVIKAEKINPPESEKEEMKPLPEPEPAKEKAPVKKPAPAVKKAEPAPVRAAPVRAAPEPEPKTEPVKEVAPKPAPKAAVKPKKKSVAATPAPVQAQEKAPAEKSPKIKWNKPPKGKQKSVAVEPAPVPAPASRTEPIGRDEALRAAIQVAPPFKRSIVRQGNYKGQPVYEVTLLTEDGEETILVDAMTGKIVH